MAGIKSRCERIPKCSKNFFKKGGDYFYFVFRIFVGLLFYQHGMQKLFGFFGGHAVPVIGFLGLAAIIEFAGGLAITFGFFTRLAAIIAAVEMIVAYFKVHFPKGIIPIVNRAIYMTQPNMLCFG